MENEKFLVIVKKGTFYRANEESGIALHNITRYKLNRVSNGKIYCGFPENALTKVLVKLKSCKVSYQVYAATAEDPNHLEKEQCFGEENRYEKYCVMESDDEIYQFISTVCDVCEFVEQNQKDKPKDLRFVLDLEDPEIRENFIRIKRKLWEIML